MMKQTIFLIGAIPCFYLALVEQPPAKHYFFVLAIWFIYMFIHKPPYFQKEPTQNIGLLCIVINTLVAFLPLVSYVLFRQLSEYSGWLVIILLLLIGGNLLMKMRLNGG
ncbi:hypothetical protein [Metasolibacillus meyeri]|uniref:hypothetical protein n=1 Tax=Metasolibacillus meyeri TaxID=1071052 RepID=UPI000D303809|nr:hypothetical protein [Metasolibacillus meyeri]